MKSVKALYSLSPPPDFQFTTEELNTLVETMDNNFSRDIVISKLGPVQSGAGLEKYFHVPAIACIYFVRICSRSHTNTQGSF